MKTILPLKKQTAFTLIFVLISFFSCQKELSTQGGALGTSDAPADLTTKINSTVSGFVTDENNKAVLAASVKFGNSTSTTDKYGYFEFKNVEVVKEAAFVSVSKTGYFKGIKTYAAKTGKTAFFRIKLIPKTNTGNISATAGGNVSLSNGLIVALPGNAVVNASTGATYSGLINVASYWINPEANDVNEIMPGDLRGINTTGTIKLLQTYGMAAVELTGASGELLQIGNSKKATLTFPLPASLIATAPASIPLWSFDESNGLWKEDGTAAKTGSNYVGDVSHFSYWNCDYPLSNPVPFECSVVDPAGLPVANAAVWTYYASNNQLTGAHGVTDANGYTSGFVPANSQLIVKVYGPCGNSNNGNLPLYAQNFTTTTTPVSLLNLPVSNGGIANISGVLVDCNNQPVASGYLIMYAFGQYYHTYNITNGNFSFNIPLCSGTAPATFTGEDNTNQQAGIPISTTLILGANPLGNVVACGTNTQQFVNYTLNGTPTSFVSPTDFFLHGVSSQIPANANGNVSAYRSSYTTFASIIYAEAGIGLNSVQDLKNFNISTTSADSMLAPSATVPVNITEYGAVGQYISGNFSGPLTGSVTNTVYNVTCNFRVKRSQ